MNTKKFAILFISINIVLLSAVIIFLINNFSLSGEINEQMSMMTKVNYKIDSLQKIKSDILNQTETNSNEIDRLRKIKENSFPEFAKRFIASIKSSGNYLEYTESIILVSSIDGDKMYNNYMAFGNSDYYKNKKIRVGRDQIYFYDIITEYSEKGTEQGVTLFFRKDGAGNYKLYKMSIDGC
ncbi:MAG: hypothetical protein K1X86_16070 [Ignavibacteria bacterium]|nr:hypothetical protein [Ignavibacteria bacterium]